MPNTIDTVGSSTAIGGIAIRMLGIGDRLADGDVLDAGEADDVARRRPRNLDALQPLEGEQLGHARLLHRSVELEHDDRVVRASTRPLKMRPMAMRPR